MSQRALPGFRDFYPAEFADRAFLFATWRRVARQFGFVEYDGPPLEPLELYTQKSGEEIVGQLYNFVDKGDRQVALRPEMTPTVARLVGARAAALPKPVRWFSIPQLFRYERQQRGRLREHYQLNVDLFGEPDVLADAELLCVALEIMRAFGLGPTDVRARVSDRRLLNALLTQLGVTDEQAPTVYAVLDKLERQPRAVSEEKLATAGLDATCVASIMEFGSLDFDATVARYGDAAIVKPHLTEFATYRDHLRAMGVLEYVRFDLTIVRGLAYYTGIVFELFDATGEFRAICGGGRYDTLLKSLGGPDVPALGFGMGDVVLGELLRARGKLTSTIEQPDFWLVPDEGTDVQTVLRTARALRDADFGVVHLLDADKLWNRKARTQLGDAQRHGARMALRLIPTDAADLIQFGAREADRQWSRIDLAPLFGDDSIARDALVAALRDALTAAPAVAT
jgi:histidyl-tRNA synthetase